MVLDNQSDTMWNTQLNSMLSTAALDKLTFNEAGLIPAVVQSASSKRVLMVAWMNRESIIKTFTLGETVFFSRSRQELWHKGETSGNTQRVVRVEVDCDSDCLLIFIAENGPACHSGTESCFDAAVLGEVNHG